MQWEHVAAQAEFARLAAALADVFLPDATDSRTSSDLTLKLAESSACTINGSSWLPASPGHSARPIESVAMRGFRAPGATSAAAATAGGESSNFCAYLVVVNMCPSPTHFAILLPEEVPKAVTHVAHQFRAVRNVSLVQGGRVFADELEGYGSAVLRVGCENSGAQSY